MKGIPFKYIIPVVLLFSGMFIATKLWRDQFDFLQPFQRSWTVTLLIILAFSITVIVICIFENRKPAKNEQGDMGKRNLLKCVLLTASFFVIFYLWEYYEFVIESEGSFWEFFKIADYSLLFFLSVLALLTYAFKMGFSNFFGDPDKTEEERLLPDQGAENVVPGYIEDYAVCENCQKASVDINATLAQCPMCKAQFKQGNLVAK